MSRLHKLTCAIHLDCKFYNIQIDDIKYYYELFTPASHWSLSDSKTRHISRTLLSILSDLKNLVVWTGYFRFFHEFPVSPDIFFQNFGDSTKFTKDNLFYCHSSCSIFVPILVL